MELVSDNFWYKRCHKLCWKSFTNLPNVGKESFCRNRKEKIQKSLKMVRSFLIIYFHRKEYIKWIIIFFFVGKNQFVQCPSTHCETLDYLRINMDYFCFWFFHRLDQIHEHSIQFNTFCFYSRNICSCSPLSPPQALMFQNCVNTCHHQCHNNHSM